MSKRKLHRIGLFLVVSLLTAHPIFAHAKTIPSAAPYITHIATSSGLPGVIVFSQVNSSGESWLHYSLDSGNHWQPAWTMPVNGSIAGLAIAPRPDPQYPVRFLFTDGWPNSPNGKLYRSGDFGATWAEQHFPENMSGSAFELVASPVDAQRIYLSAQTTWVEDPPGCFPIICDTYYGFVYSSTDAGVSWTETAQDRLRSFGSLAASPVQAQHRYAEHRYSSGHDWYRGSDGSYHEWPGVDILVLDAVDADKLYGVEASSATFTTTSVLTHGQTSPDGGITWTPWGSMPGGCTQLQAHPTQTKTLYLLCGGDVYRSTDAGNTWNLPAGATAYGLVAQETSFLAPDYGTPGRLLWARADGLWASQDNGAAWQQLAAIQPPIRRIFLPAMMRLLSMQ